MEEALIGGVKEAQNGGEIAELPKEDKGRRERVKRREERLHRKSRRKKQRLHRGKGVKRR